MAIDSSKDPKEETKASLGLQNLIDRLGGDSIKNRILAYFILEKSSSVSYGDISQKCSLSEEEIRGSLGVLTRDGILKNEPPQIYSLNIHG